MTITEGKRSTESFKAPQDFTARHEEEAPTTGLMDPKTREWVAPTDATGRLMGPVAHEG
jgi:hypothetical protein